MENIILDFSRNEIHEIFGVSQERDDEMTSDAIVKATDEKCDAVDIIRIFVGQATNRQEIGLQIFNAALYIAQEAQEKGES